MIKAENVVIEIEIYPSKLFWKEMHNLLIYIYYGQKCLAPNTNSQTINNFMITTKSIKQQKNLWNCF